MATTVVALNLAVQAFTLSWTHSVERTEWREDWRVQHQQLVLDEARVRGSGAGMDPGDGAILRDGWWIWPGNPVPLAVLHLAVSGATGSGWLWCAKGYGCHDLERWLTRNGQAPEQIQIDASDQRCEPLKINELRNEGHAALRKSSDVGG
ncbi:MAG: DUF1850 domain-containing protein [Rubrivivax sp.]